MSGASTPDASLPLAVLERIDAVCLQFEAGWKKGEPVRIEQYLGDTRGAERTQLLRELLVLELDYRTRQGRRPTEDEYQARFPEDSLTIAEVFRRARTRSLTQGGTPGTGAAAGEGDLPRAFGQYELLEVLGGGGMGLVYLARQQAADRIVALKVIRPDHLAAAFPQLRQEALERFRIECRAAAQLEHDHIVPIYDVGEVDLQPYYSMKLVDGKSLSEILRDGPLESRDAAALLEPVARAVQFAHQSGMMHRDLKPHNILVGSDRRPYVADFGLAKSLEAAAELTQNGEPVGAPAYMAPEQARAEPVGPRGDVYSLGATLYEMLTGRAPFRAATSAETLRQVIEKEPVSPRLLNPRVPRDLETICLKCLEKLPARRYATAQELAEELRRFQLGEPIRARPITSAGRLWRWCRRNPVPASLSAVLFVVLLAVGIASPIVAIQQSQLAATAQSHVEDAERNRLIAEDKLDDLRAVTDRLLFHVATESEIPPSMFPLRARLLEEALTVYEELHAEQPDDALLARIAETRGYLASGYRALGKTVEAEQAYTQSIHLLAHLGEEAEQKDRQRFDRLRLESCCQFADFYRETGRHDEALVLLNQARPEAEALYLQDQKNLANAFCICVIDYTLGSVYAERKPPDLVKAKEAWHRAISIEPHLADAPPGELLDRSHHMLGSAYLELGRRVPKEAASSPQEDLAEARRLLQTAEGHLSGIQGRWANSPLVTAVRADVLVQLAKVTENADQQYALLLQARRLLEKTVKHTPSVPRYKYDLAMVIGRMVTWHQVRKDGRAVMSLIPDSIDLLREAVDQAPQIPEFRRALCEHYQFMAAMLEENAQTEVRIFTVAAHYLLLAADALVDDPAFASENRQQLVGLAARARDIHERAETVAITPADKALVALCMASSPVEQLRDERALQIAEAAAVEAGDSAAYSCLSALGVARYRAGQWPQALQALEQAYGIAPRADPKLCFFLAMARLKNGDEESAQKAFAEAIELSQEMNILEHLRPFHREAAILLRSVRPQPEK